MLFMPSFERRKVGRRVYKIVKEGDRMKKWYDEEYEFTVEVTGFLHGDHTEHYCRNDLMR